MFKLETATDSLYILTIITAMMTMNIKFVGDSILKKLANLIGIIGNIAIITNAIEKNTQNIESLIVKLEFLICVTTYRKPMNAEPISRILVSVDIIWNPPILI